MTRREFVWAAAAGKGRLFPSEVRRYADPATEFTVERLTSPEHAGFLPPACCRAASRSGSFILYASDREGSMQLFRLDLSSGRSRQLTNADALDRTSFALLPGDRSFCYFDGQALRLATLQAVRDIEIYRVAEDRKRVPHFAASADGAYVTVIEAAGQTHAVRAVWLAGGAPAATVAESATPIALALPRPRHREILYRDASDALRLAALDGGRPRNLKTAGGRLGSVRWRPDGEAILYLSVSVDGRTSLRELSPDTGNDQALATTSRFVEFAPNSDASVFIGASGSIASPYIVLLLRITRRELALCEHRASDPRLTSPVFSPDSQRIYFQSDRDGKPAIYSMDVHRLVEAT